MSFSACVPVSTFGPQMHGVMLVLVWARAGNSNCGLLGRCRVGWGLGVFVLEPCGRVGAGGQACRRAFFLGPFGGPNFESRTVSPN